MNQEKTGAFISICRKEKGYTQAVLAEKLGITDRAVSKWENGKSMPDIGIMQELCELLDININELLSGERLNMDNYKRMAEDNLTELARLEELNNKKLLTLEIVIGGIATVTFLALAFSASFAVEQTAWRIIMILVGTAVFVIGIYYSLKLEHDAGYYECQACHKRYVPTMKAVVMAPHRGRSRKMKCPYCNSRNYHKKVLTKD